MKPKTNGDWLVKTIFSVLLFALMAAGGTLWKVSAETDAHLQEEINRKVGAAQFNEFRARMDERHAEVMRTLARIENMLKEHERKTNGVKHGRNTERPEPVDTSSPPQVRTVRK